MKEERRRGIMVYVDQPQGRTRSFKGEFIGDLDDDQDFLRMSDENGTLLAVRRSDVIKLVVKNARGQK